MSKNISIASNIINQWESRFRDYVESSILTDRETVFADCIEALFEAFQYLIIELEKMEKINQK